MKCGRGSLPKKLKVGGMLPIIAMEIEIGEIFMDRVLINKKGRSLLANLLLFVFLMGMIYFTISAIGEINELSSGISIATKIKNAGEQEADQQAQKLKEDILLLNYSLPPDKTRILAESGNSLAQHRLGYYYYTGKGVKQDHREAAKWYLKAAEKGELKAQTDIGSLYLKGEGLPQDYKEAFKWFQMAAERGDTEAQYKLAFRFIMGEGISSDNIQAYVWLNIAIAGGLADATEARNTLAKIMNSEEIEIAQNLTRLKMTEIENRKSVKEDVASLSSHATTVDIATVSVATGVDDIKAVVSGLYNALFSQQNDGNPVSGKEAIKDFLTPHLYSMICQEDKRYAAQEYDDADGPAYRFFPGNDGGDFFKILDAEIGNGVASVSVIFLFKGNISSSAGMKLVFLEKQKDDRWLVSNIFEFADGRCIGDMLSNMALAIQETPVSGNTPVEEVGEITAKSGATMRDLPNRKGKKLMVLPMAMRVVILSKDGPKETIEDNISNWYKVKTSDGTEGWVFGGLISIASQ